MTDQQQLRVRLERLSQRIEPSPGSFDRLTERRARIKRRHKIGTIAVALAISASGTFVAIRALGSQSAPGPLAGSNGPVSSVDTHPPCPVSSTIRLVGTGGEPDAAHGFDTDCLAIIADRETPVRFVLEGTGTGGPQVLAFCTHPDCRPFPSGVLFRTDVLTAPAVVTGTLPALAPGTYFFQDAVHLAWGGTLYVVPPGDLAESILNGSSPLGADLARMLGLQLQASFKASLPCQTFIEVDAQGEGYCIEGLGDSDVDRLVIGDALQGYRWPDHPTG